jgi:hypothetical protein
MPMAAVSASLASRRDTFVLTLRLPRCSLATGKRYAHLSQAKNEEHY